MDQKKQTVVQAFDGKPIRELNLSEWAEVDGMLSRSDQHIRNRNG